MYRVGEQVNVIGYGVGTVTNVKDENGEPRYIIKFPNESVDFFYDNNLAPLKTQEPPKPKPAAPVVEASTLTVQTLQLLINSLTPDTIITGFIKSSGKPAVVVSEETAFEVADDGTLVANIKKTALIKY